MNALMMHCGAEPITQPQLLQVKTPAKTDTHFPIPHHQFYDLAESKLALHGYQLQNPRHFLNREGAHYFALMEIHHADEDYDQEHSTMCALRNTHDKTFAASLAVGARVFVCDNLSFSGDIVVGRKHTTNIWDELPEIIDGAVGRIRVMRKHQDIRFMEYRQAPLDDYTADHILMETYRQGIINLKRIGKVNSEWQNPSQNHGDKTVWRYFNAVTSALGPQSNAALMTLPKKTIDLHLLLDKFCNVDFESEPEPASFIERIKHKVLN